MATIAKGSKVLVTGCNGYVGTQIVKSLLEAGYIVKGTIRSESSARKVIDSHPAYKENLSLAIVPDITAPGAFDEAVKGVDAVS